MLLLAAASSASQIFRYREQTGADSFTFLWRADQGRKEVIVTQNQGDETYSSVCAPDGTTLSWHYIKQPDTDIRAERLGDRIHLSGRFAGAAIDKHQPIDTRPWYQPLSFSLQRMVARDQQTAVFWTIRPDTLEVVAMKAEKSGREEISMGNETQTADKVVIRLDGLMSALWQAEYWFRPSDNLFVQYKGTHGLPGTAETSINLITP
ncbi:hypothetical protein JZU56_02545 [bacterium]|nr:hypothetical protein [bacterium]